MFSSSRFPCGGAPFPEGKAARAGSRDSFPGVPRIVWRRTAGIDQGKAVFAVPGPVNEERSNFGPSFPVSVH